MDINSLRVFNSIHNLGITEEEFKEIEEEQKHKERTGLAIKCVKKGYCIGVWHDESREIVIKKIELPIPIQKGRILFQTLITFEDLPNEIYVLHRIAHYRSFDTKIRRVATNLEELKDIICNRFVNGSPRQLGTYNYYYAGGSWETEKIKKNVEEELKAIFWLFGEKYEGLKTNSRKGIAKIVKVFQRKNRRLAIFYEDEKFYLKTFKPEDDRYNYVDPDREVYLHYDKEIWICDELLGRISEEELELIAENERANLQRKNFLILDVNKYNELKFHLISAKRRAKEREAREKLVKKTQEDFFVKGKVIRGGIEFTRDSMCYQGIKVGGDRFGEFLVDDDVILWEQPNFAQIYHRYIDYVLRTSYTYDYFGDEVEGVCFNNGDKLKIFVGKINLEVFRQNNLFYIKIGDKRYRIKEVDLPIVLKRALEFKSPEDYEKFLKYTSKFCLDLQEIIENGGVEIEVRIETNKLNDLITKDETTLIALPIVMKNNKIFAIINNKEYKVRDTNALIELQRRIEVRRWNFDYLGRTIRLLYRALKDITHKEIGEIIEQGKEEYRKMMERIEEENRKKIERSKEFLENAVRLSGAVKTNGGWLVKGMSGNVYLVEKDARVWTIKKEGDKIVKDKYLCIVDSNASLSTEWELNDGIARRLLALSKDSVIANEIYQEGHRVDDFWVEV